MTKIIYLNKNNTLPETDVLQRIEESSTLLDYEIKTWKHEHQKWWGNYTRILTVVLDIVSFILVILFAFDLIHLPIIELVFTIGFRLVLNRRIILQYLFNKDSP
jgi:hypothetical protein